MSLKCSQAMFETVLLIIVHVERTKFVGSCMCRILNIFWYYEISAHLLLQIVIHLHSAPWNLEI